MWVLIGIIAGFIVGCMAWFVLGTTGASQQIFLYGGAIVGGFLGYKHSKKAGPSDK